MTVEEFKGLLNEWTSHSWLHNQDFRCDDTIIEQSIIDFEPDYKRWYPNDSCISVYNFQKTPQLIAMLLYRISRALYISDLEPGCKRCLLSSCKAHWTNRAILFS